MEHIRSTLATTAAAVLGLVVAAHVLHPGNFEAQPRPAKRTDVVATASAPASTVVWSDPPAGLRGTATPVTATVEDASSALRVAVAPPQEVAPPPLPHEMTAPTVPIRKAVRASRSGKSSGAARHTARTRQGAPIRVAAATASAPAAQDTGKSAGFRIDPIGGLIRGLGFDLGS